MERYMNGGQRGLQSFEDGMQPRSIRVRPQPKFLPSTEIELRVLLESREWRDEAVAALCAMSRKERLQNETLRTIIKWSPCLWALEMLLNQDPQPRDCRSVVELDVLSLPESDQAKARELQDRMRTLLKLQQGLSC